jgi:hypothetical protein
VSARAVCCCALRCVSFSLSHIVCVWGCAASLETDFPPAALRFPFAFLTCRMMPSQSHSSAPSAWTLCVSVRLVQTVVLTPFFFPLLFQKLGALEVFVRSWCVFVGEVFADHATPLLVCLPSQPFLHVQRFRTVKIGEKTVKLQIVCKTLLPLPISMVVCSARMYSHRFDFYFPPNFIFLPRFCLGPPISSRRAVGHCWTGALPDDH